MSWKSIEAAQRRRQREEQNRLRELERRAKEEAKLSLIEQARLEVKTYENRLDLLLSVHKEQGNTWDWAGLAASLPPPYPKKNSYHELRAKQRIEVLSPDQKQKSEAMVEQARRDDEQIFQDALVSYSKEKDEWEKLITFSRRILAGEHKAYTEALVQFNPWAAISGMGSQIRIHVHDATFLVCVLTVKGVDVIPSEVKTLTSTGKVSVKPMPKARSHELYQDCLCSCILRVAREVFAMLPVETILVTASADSIDASTGQTVDQPVLSVAMPREVVARLEFNRLDPSEAMENFLHRGDFKASRKSGAFLAITPLTQADLPTTCFKSMDVCDLVAHIRQLREELKTEIGKLSRSTTAPAS
jgi:hypothetical protein